MNKMSTNMFIFAVGAAIGSAVAWLYAKKHYERIANEEIESIKNGWLVESKSRIKKKKMNLKLLFRILLHPALNRI